MNSILSNEALDKMIDEVCRKVIDVQINEKTNIEIKVKNIMTSINKVNVGGGGIYRPYAEDPATVRGLQLTQESRARSFIKFSTYIDKLLTTPDNIQTSCRNFLIMDFLSSDDDYTDPLYYTKALNLCNACDAKIKDDILYYKSPDDEDYRTKPMKECYDEIIDIFKNRVKNYTPENIVDKINLFQLSIKISTDIYQSNELQLFGTVDFENSFIVQNNTLITGFQDLLKYVEKDKAQGQVNEKVNETTQDQTQDQVNESVNETVNGQTKGQTQGQTKDQAQGQTKGQTQGQTKDQAQGQTKGQAQGQAQGQTKGQTKGQAQNRTQGQVNETVNDKVRGQTKGQANSGPSKMFLVLIIVILSILIISASLYIWYRTISKSKNKIQYASE